ncbi:nucleotide-diphospho-sugar transferase [Basidiobolus meristosporus CBS 931.73]|uniref:UDP-N-acetylglucosamine diphosphorylase n=1 Tax=Basidiobolus meristosporus CBS 931.73 TaxID=1314790 RepID=A0A1Y1W1L1_9FUNG|nr:nucleotide-diphospho-sugar transferase [Basidiobolus meristosporus CBS 931.73]|eukprot:ORX67372.1 nucleotide-diphospho-sugar transferase [Basidiobolus meristosporus CBS 931.73]
MPIPTPDIEVLRQRFVAAGQEQVLAFFDELSPLEQSGLIAQLNALDVNRVNRIFKKATSGSAATNQDTASIEPLPEDCFESALNCSPSKIQDWEDLGLKMIAEGKVAVILMAGGQGSRLGSALPKGCYDIGLPSKKSLFQLQAERLTRLQQLAQERCYDNNKKVVIPWYVMTSGPTRQATVEHFKSHNYFGLEENNIFFFNQGTLPCMTMDGKIMLEKKGQVAVAPDGNGGIYAALRNEGVLDDLAARGVEYIHSYCVDNCLVHVADPVFIGYCISKNADCGVKTVPKSAPEEPVGVVCLRNKKFGVVEYSEINDEIAHRTGPNGKLAFGAANIANHFYTRDFLNSVESFEQNLEYHIARKKIKHVDLTLGETVAPTKPNGLKLELFVFDVFPFTKRMAVFEVDRKEEFSPLKNAPGTGVDCPETSRRDIIAQQIRFVENAGGKVDLCGESPETVMFEISPLLSYSGEGLEMFQGKTITAPAIFQTMEDVANYAH